MPWMADDLCYYELVDPETKTPIPMEHGAKGEAMFTMLAGDGFVGLRQSMGDIHQVFTEPCPCSRTGFWYKVIGRADHLLRVKSVMVYPSHIKGVINGVEPAYKLMVEQGFGPVVNTASIKGLCPFPGTSSSVAAKYAVVGLSGSMWLEGSDLGGMTSVVCPGYVRTPIFDVSEKVKVDAEDFKKSLSLFERLGEDPDQCARIILDGVAKNKHFILVTFTAKSLCWLNRLSPGLYICFFRWYTRKDRQTMHRAE